jgi:hypothetical protein
LNGSSKGGKGSGSGSGSAEGWAKPKPEPGWGHAKASGPFGKADKGSKGSGKGGKGSGSRSGSAEGWSEPELKEPEPEPVWDGEGYQRMGTKFHQDIALTEHA